LKFFSPYPRVFSYPISFGTFRVFSSAQNSRTLLVLQTTRQARIKYSVIREAQPRNARDLRRLRALAVAALFRLGSARHNFTRLAGRAP
jgi:hypothetical protein